LFAFDEPVYVAGEPIEAARVHKGKWIVRNVAVNVLLGRIIVAARNQRFSLRLHSGSSQEKDDC